MIIYKDPMRQKAKKIRRDGKFLDWNSRKNDSWGKFTQDKLDELEEKW
jgi:hypothetical protein